MNIQIAEPSIKSLHLELRVNGHGLSTGTGFVTTHQDKPYLITNWHNLSGRHPDTNQPLSTTGGLPDEVQILHNASIGLGNWVKRSEQLHSNSAPLWLEHPIYRQSVDVVALPLTNLKDVRLFPYSWPEPSDDMFVGPADTVSVVGFPFGLTGGAGLAIWATGFVASEPDVPYQNLPRFLIDCRSRPGQSGSPVVAHRSGGWIGRKTGATTISAGNNTRFLGIYSGRINAQSDLGIVWTPKAITEILQGQTLGLV